MKGPIVHAHIVVAGRVQGVGFRMFVKVEAERLGLTGTVRNHWDGTVEVRVEGTRERIERLTAQLERGNRLSGATECVVTYSDNIKQFVDFNIIP